MAIKRLRREEDVIKELKKQGRVYQYLNPTLEQAKEAKLYELELDHAARMKQMQFATGDSKKVVTLQITDELPQLLSTCLWGLIRVQEGFPNDTQNLVDADGISHPITASDWMRLGKEMNDFFHANMDATMQQRHEIKNATKIEAVLGKKIGGKK
jgi:hypothetical protein